MKQDGTDEQTPHGNSHQNQRPHHLYEIWDETDQETFKFGISNDPVTDDGLSKRLRQQVSLYNLIAGFIRYIGRILIVNIQGREKAERLEDQHIDDFEAKHGRFPKGNLKRNRKK